MSSESKKEEEVSQYNPSNNTSNIDNVLLQEFLGKVMSDLGGAYSAVLVYVGDKLGLYKAMAEADGQSNNLRRASFKDWNYRTMCKRMVS